MDNFPDEFREQLDLAIQIRREALVPIFTEREKRILGRVFSNTDKNTYFIYGLPEELVTTLLARYSRIKNPRGLRGLFLDDFVTNIPIIGKIFTDPEGFLKEYGEVENRPGVRIVDIPVEELEKLMGMGFSLGYYGSVVTIQKIKEFLTKFLDAYGHNSIARMGIVHLALENISILAAKTVEWARPGAGYIELSTRFVDMRAKELYPAWRFFTSYYRKAESIEKHAMACMGAYEDLYPVCVVHFEREFAHLDPSKAAITGKVCDSLGNLLPCSTLTSLGVSMMGEAYQSVVRHLIADANPECAALAFEIIEEAKKVGNRILLGNHYMPGATDHIQYQFWIRDYPNSSQEIRPDVFVKRDYLVPNALALESIIKMSGANIDATFLEARNLFNDLGKRNSGHESYEKLPDWFEHASGIFSGLMSFRSWRDLQRMGFCTHKRGWVTPNLGMYLPPDMPQEFIEKYSELHLCERFLCDSDLTTSMYGFRMLAQYAYMVGNFVPYIVGANLREWEFVNWQRTKWGVNEEVRKVVLRTEEFLRYEYPWWERISRADTTWEYVFARGPKAIPKK